MTKYACIHINKTAVKDLYEEGEIPETEVCRMFDPCNITATTLQGLLEAINNAYCLDMTEESCYIPIDQDGNDKIDTIHYECLETDDSQTPDKVQMKLWKRGQMILYNITFRFTIEKRESQPVTRQELETAGIKFL